MAEAKLKELTKDLGPNLGARALFREFKKRYKDTAVTQAQVANYVKQIAAKQLVGPQGKPLPQGKAHAEKFTEEGSRWMMDIAVFGKLSSLGNDEVRYALCMMNVYSRDLGAVVLKDRTAPSVARALRSLPNSLKARMKGGILSMDAETAFASAEVQAVLREIDVATKLKDPRGGSANDLAPLDRKIQSLKQGLAARRIETPSADFKALLSAQVKAENAKINSTIRDSADDVSKDNEAGRALRFMIQKDQSANVAINAANAQKRTAALEKDGAMRAKFKDTPFQRSFEARHGRIQLVNVVTGGLVKPQGSDKVYDTRNVMAVSSETRAERTTTSRRDNEKRQETMLIADALKEYLKVDEEKPLRNAGPWLRRYLGAEEYSRLLKGTNLAGVLALHSQYKLRAGAGASKDNLIVKRIR